MQSVAPALDIGLKSVLTAFDFSPASHKPLQHALAIARHYSANFYLTHVVSALGYTLAGPPALELATEAARRDAELLREKLIKTGALAGLQHEFIVRRGNVWEELEMVIREKQPDLVVVGTHGRRTLGKLILGSVAEQIFRHTSRLVLTVGPGSSQNSLIEDARAARPFLFATDFGTASLRALPYAISFANHFGAKLVLLHVAPAIPVPEGFHWSSTTSDVREMREDARRSGLQQLEDLVLDNPHWAVKPECLVKFGMPSKEILQVAHALNADLILMGLHRSAHIETASHLPWATAYQVVCSAECPVLTMRS